MIILPFFDNNLQPKVLLAFATLDKSGTTTIYNVSLKNDTPFHRLKKVTEDDFIKYILSDNNNTFYKTKALYKKYGLDHNIKDANALLWKNNLDINYFKIDSGLHDIAPLTRDFSNLFFEDHFSLFFNHRYSDNLYTLSKASSILDGYYMYDDEKKYKYFDHYTKGGRFRDSLSNSINTEAKNRGKIRAKGVKVYVDIDSFHLRLLDQNLGINMIPRNERGHDWVIKQAFGNNPPEDIKIKIFQALYAEKFYLVPCEFMDFVSLRYKQLKSPLGRTGRTFNDKVQELDVLEMSKIILSVADHGYKDILLYLYDGLLYDVPVKKLTNFLEVLQNCITFPFKVNINDEELRFD